MFEFLPHRPHPPTPSAGTGEGRTCLVFSMIHLTPQPPLYAVERGSGGEVLEKVSSPQSGTERGLGAEVSAFADRP